VPPDVATPASANPDQTLNPALGTLLVIAAAVLFAIKGIFIKLAYQHGVTPSVLLTLRMLISLPFYIVIMIRHRARLPLLKPNVYLQIMALGLCAYYLASLLDLLGLQYVSASLERMIIYLYPTFVVILGALFLGKKVSRKELACLACAYAGISILFTKDLSLSATQEPLQIAGIEVDAIAWGSLLTVGSALSFSIYVAFSETLIRQIGAAVFTSISMFTASSAILLQYLATHTLAELAQPLPVYGYAFLLAMLSTVLAVYLMAEGIRHVGSSRAGTLGTMGPVVTLIIAAAVLDEPIGISHIVGIIVVCSSIYALTRIR
jgi:drug/metabolite transporter (DMT)-like permease